MAPRDILRKDYKDWQDDSKGLSAAANENIKLGISSTVQSFAWLYSEHPDFNTDIANWAENENLSICAVMATSTDSQNNFQRELAVYATEDAKDLLDTLLQKASGPLQLEPKVIPNATDDRVLIFQQKNVAASRKQVAPIFRNALYGTSLPAL
ncbi:Ppx1p [Sugiyamaella lignohabitans]|uniref:Ppx1p n=1 Tax=Sugiyamaella lignohabitans TaxID=796027 RepID=A0A161HIH0_9ASCO|nr:Ppx1p [Sugiyamaella lignohabitans]ANB12287.1 Ppx1p [Sugiyamaella lignohabitans]